MASPRCCVPARRRSPRCAPALPKLRVRGQQSRWDTHPPLGARVDAIMAAPETTATIDNSPAAGLIADLGAAGRALQARALRLDGAVQLPWDEFLAAADGAALQEESDAMLRVFTRAVGQPVEDVGAVLDLIAAGRLDDLAAPILPDATRREARKRFADPLATLLALAAVRSGAARWQHSWTGPTPLLGTDGSPLDLADVAGLACDPVTLPGPGSACWTAASTSPPPSTSAAGSAPNAPPFSPASPRPSSTASAPTC